MRQSKYFLISILVLFFYGSSFAEDENYIKLQQAFKTYFSDMVTDVKAVESAEEKREIIFNSLNEFSEVLDKAAGVTAKSETDKKFISNLKADINYKIDELKGKNGFSKVVDSDLNSFANYIQQDMEQADKVLTISLTTALLIIIIILLIA